MAKVDTFKLKGQVLDARYEVESVVGEGGFGVVYRATQVNFEEPVAIKVLKIPSQLSSEEADTFIQTFRAEGKHLRKLSSEHPAFVRAHDTGVIDVDGVPAPYLVLEWLDGAALEDELKNRRNSGEHGRSIEESMQILEPIFGALAHAHAQRVAHRDIKPANIFIVKTKSGKSAKLLDFGMAKVMTASGTQGLHAATQGGLAGLTPAYAAPEQWDKKLSATGPWTDVYALALVLVELLTDQPPLDGDDMVSLMSATLDEARPTPKARGANVSDEVEAVFAKALTLYPKDRYRHAGEFWNALVEASEKETIAASGQTLAKIPAPTVVMDPSDVALETRPKVGSSKTRSKAPEEENTRAAAGESVSRSAVAAKSHLAANTESVAAPAGSERNKSSSTTIALIAASVVVLGLLAWKSQQGGTAMPTSASVTAAAPAAPSAAEVAESPKPKKKSKKWWEDIPDATDKTETAARPQLAPARQKWLALREQTIALHAEKKREEAASALRTALDLACKELGQDDPACAETMQMLAMVLAQMGKLDEAEKLLREAVKVIEKYGDKDDDDFDDSRQALVAVLLKQGKTEEAKEFWKPTDAPLPAPAASASAARAPTSARPHAAAAPAEDTRDAWTQILDEISEEKAAAKKGLSPSTTAKP
jgi:serine/threonine protein kinase